MRLAPHPLIYDWNHDTVAEGPQKPVAMLDDETLRDGLQSPSVRNPTIEEKIGILHHMDALGIDTADIGLPGAGPKVARDVERLARAIGDGRLNIRANCAARTLISDIRPIAEIQQRTGVPIECGAFIGSSPIRQFAEGWTLDFLQKCTEEAIAFAVKEKVDVMYVTEDTTRADPESLRRLFTTAIRAGARRLCVADTVGHATPNGAKSCRLLLLNANRPMTMNMIRMPILMQTMIVFTRADSCEPRISRNTQSATRTTAGMLTYPPSPGGWLIASGIRQPNTSTNTSFRYWPQPTTIAPADTPYSSRRHQPTQ